MLVVSLPTYRILSHLSFFCNIFLFSNIYFVCLSISIHIHRTYILFLIFIFCISPYLLSALNFLYLLRINTDFRILIHRLHNLFHILFFHSYAATCIWVTSCTMQKNGRTLFIDTFFIVIKCQRIIIMRLIINQMLSATTGSG